MEGNEKNGKVLGSVFPGVPGVCGRGRYFRCLRALWTGSGRDRTAQHGRFFVVFRAPVRIRMGGAQLSNHMLECKPVCGGLSHPQ